LERVILPSLSYLRRQTRRIKFFSSVVKKNISCCCPSKVGTDKDLQSCQNCQMAASFILVSRVADPDPGSGAFLTPGSGMGKKSRSGSGMNILDHTSESLEYLNSLMRMQIRNPGIFLTLDPGWKNSDPGQTSRIRNTVGVSLPLHVRSKDIDSDT
jgi:hypothetical protein